MTLILNTVIQYFHWTLWLWWSTTKLGLAAKEHASTYCDCDLKLQFNFKTATPSCSHDTPDYDEVSLYQVCLQKIQQFRRYCLEFFHVHCDLMIIYHETKFGYKCIISSGDIVKTIVCSSEKARHLVCRTSRCEHIRPVFPTCTGFPCLTELSRR